MGGVDVAETMLGLTRQGLWRWSLPYKCTRLGVLCRPWEFGSVVRPTVHPPTLALLEWKNDAHPLFTRGADSFSRAEGKSPCDEEPLSIEL